jgi:hypothetical protein
MKPVFTRQIYWSGDNPLELVIKAEEIMEREQWSFNRIMLEALGEYVHRHEEGNVSFQLDKFGITWTKAESVDQKEKHCRFCESKTVYARAVKNGIRIFLCKDHFFKEKVRLEGYEVIR